MANVDDHDGVRTEIKVYRRRYVILAIFALLSASNSLQWIEYSIIANTVVQFYSIEYIMVDFTSMIYMASYILFIVPASWYLDKYGLRASILLGALGNSLGALLKIFSAHPDKFWLSFIGQSIAGSSQVFTLGVPSRLAATWFQTEHVATACAVGVFGNQLGIAIGFIIPPLIVPTTGVDQIASGLMTLFIVSASANLVVFVLVILFFQEKPKRPPSIAQSLLVGRKESYTETLKNLMTNLNYSLLFVTYGLNTGVFYGISTLLTQIISQYFSDSEKLSGIIGLILVLSGMFGSIICGVILDRLRCYKNFTLVIYLFSAACMLLFTFSLFLSQQWIIFIITAALGFFMTGYLPIGFEFAAELTYPIPESTTAGLLNASAQVFGIITTLLMGQIIHKWGAFLCNIIGSCSLAFGLILTENSHGSDLSVDINNPVSNEIGTRKKRPEDNIPTIEIRGEGKPMTAAQIRQLEEDSNGGPLDIKVEHTWHPINCPRSAKRKDFVTFHYKTFTESGRKCDQSYGRKPIRLQLGVGMMMPGLDKGIKGICDTELRKIQVPYRLSRKQKSRVWRNVPNDEHWLTFNIEMLTVERWSLQLQFEFLDLNNDTKLTENELVKFQETIKKDFGKTWNNNDIDQIIAAKYYIKYFDANGDNEIDIIEFTLIMERDMLTMKTKAEGKNLSGKKRDPSIGWILDFNNDGVVSIQENDEAAEVLEHGPSLLPTVSRDEL